MLLGTDDVRPPALSRSTTVASGTFIVSRQACSEGVPCVTGPAHWTIASAMGNACIGAANALVPGVQLLQADSETGSAIWDAHGAKYMCCSFDKWELAPMTFPAIEVTPVI